MNTETISKTELDLIVSAIREKHMALEAEEGTSTIEHGILLRLENRLSSISGEKFTLKEADA